MDAHRISELAKRTGFTASTLRYYEQVGLLRSARSPAGYRLYGEDAVARLRFIARSKQLGLPLDDIRDLVNVWDEGLCASVKARLSSLVLAKTDDVRQRVAELTELGDELGLALAALGEPTPAGPCDDDCGCPQAPTAAAAPVDVGMPKPRAEGLARLGPVACTLDADEQQDRGEQWAALLTSATAHTPIPGGMRVQFPPRPGLAGMLAELAAVEQGCCSFLMFTLDITAEGVALDVRSPPEAADLVTAVFGPPLTDADRGGAEQRQLARRSASSVAGS
jgi:DNA-binding transcriptional MerR regulator